MEKPLIIAHRGASGHAPENTLAAFRLAVAEGADAIELDVHLSSDGELVVIHDENIKKTTNGRGLVSNLTTYELKKYDAGSWFNKKFKHEKIPLLEEVFSAVPERIMINIEIKNIPSFYKGIEEKVVSVIQKYKRMDRVVVSSFDHQCLKKVAHLNREIRIGLLYNENLFDHSRYATEWGIPVYSLHPSYRVIREPDIKEAVDQGLQVFPWTVNRESVMKQLITFGVTGIITDYPGKLKDVIERIFKK